MKVTKKLLLMKGHVKNKFLLLKKEVLWTAANTEGCRHHDIPDGVLSMYVVAVDPIKVVFLSTGHVVSEVHNSASDRVVEVLLCVRLAE